MKKISSLCLALALVTATFAHEYILMAYQFVVSEGDELEIHLFVSDGFNIQLERPFQKAMTKRFELLTEHGTTDLLETCEEGDFPIWNRKVDFKGQGLLHMERNYACITLSNEDFREYLKLDNIENVTIDESGRAEQRERYTRYLKALIQSNPKPGDSLYRKVVGHTLEIVLLDNPYEANTGESIKARVLFRGEPLTNKVITARNRLGNKSATYQFSRTDAKGECSFTLDRAGEWFLHATHMIPAEVADTDWESFWVTYSFGIVGE